MAAGAEPPNRCRRESEADAERAQAHLPEGLPGPALVPTPDLRSGLLHRLWREDHAGVREAIEQKHWKEADEQIVRAADALQDEATLIDSAAQELEKGK